KVGAKVVSHLELKGSPVNVAWWVEGKHAVLIATTEKPEAAVKRMTTKSDRLATNPLYKKVTGFKQFETGARAFVDVAGIVQVVKAHKAKGKELGKVIDALGLDGVKSAVFSSGFDAPAERSLVEIDTPGPRKGLLKLFAAKPFSVSEVPPLPEDVISWSM